MAIIYWILKDKGHNADSLGFALLGAPMAADGARISLFFIALDGSLVLLFMLLFMLLRFGLPLADMG